MPKLKADSDCRSLQPGHNSSNLPFPTGRRRKPFAEGNSAPQMAQQADIENAPAVSVLRLPPGATSVSHGLVDVLLPCL